MSLKFLLNPQDESGGSIFGDGSKDVQLSYEDDLRPEVILSMDELNLDQTPQDINKEFQVERVRLQAFVAATDP
ncbi:hypothetical protein TNCV_3861941 [Trichonephila clavipes]|nr:hypothetical protein TNCV_3861941 [Trichonephila clavipes]